MKKFEVTFEEVMPNGVTHICTRTAIVENRQAVIDWYGLEEPEVLSYKIVEIE